MRKSFNTPLCAVALERESELSGLNKVKAYKEEIERADRSEILGLKFAGIK